MKLRKMETEVLVIGGGGAGLRAALAAAENGSRVILVNKGPISRSGITLTAAGGMQAPLHPDDSEEQFFQDTIRCGYGLADQNLAWVLATEACNAVKDMERYGVRFVRDGAGSPALGQFPGQAYPRNIFIKGGGVGLVAALSAACKKHGNIKILDDFFVTGLVRGQSGGKSVVAGAMGFDLRKGELTLIHSHSVVLATGGCQWLWEVNDCPTDATGDGLVYAYRIGAELIDMEMILFYPSVIVWPPSLKGAFLHYEFLAESILDGNVYDKNGAAVLPKPVPVRDQAMLLMDKAIREGRGGAHGGLFWYVGDSPRGIDAIRKRLDLAQYHYIKTHGIDPATAKIEVAPGAHYLMGGIQINEHCATSMGGLFATPECAGNVDGANRLAGSGIASTQVFGARAGRTASNWASINSLPEINPLSLEEEQTRITRRILSPGLTGGTGTGAKIFKLRDKLRSAVQLYAGVSRNQQGLTILAKEAKAIQMELADKKVAALKTYNQALLDVLQLETLCEIAGLVAGSALLRDESRGHHFRTDYPLQDDIHWLCHTSSVLSGKDPAFGTKSLQQRR